MINFFSSNKIKLLFLSRISLLVFLVFLFISSGCQTVDTKATSKESNTSIKDENTLKKDIEHPQSVNQLVNDREELEQIENKKQVKNISRDKDKLQEVPIDDEKDGFKSVKEKKTVYGPLGIVLHLTTWILEKLYILNDSVDS